MNVLKRFHPSPGMVIACLALLLALGGTGYAASRHCRGTASPACRSRTAACWRKDFKTGQLPRGPAGPAGPAGRRARQVRPAAQAATQVGARARLTAASPRSRAASRWRRIRRPGRTSSTSAAQRPASDPLVPVPMPATRGPARRDDRRPVRRRRRGQDVPDRLRHHEQRLRPDADERRDAGDHAFYVAVFG